MQQSDVQMFYVFQCKVSKKSNWSLMEDFINMKGKMFTQISKE